MHQSLCIATWLNICWFRWFGHFKVIRRKCFYSYSLSGHRHHLGVHWWCSTVCRVWLSHSEIVALSLVSTNVLFQFFSHRLLYFAVGYAWWNSLAMSIHTSSEQIYNCLSDVLFQDLHGSIANGHWTTMSIRWMRLWWLRSFGALSALLLLLSVIDAAVHGRHCRQPDTPSGGTLRWLLSKFDDRSTFTCMLYIHIVIAQLCAHSPHIWWLHGPCGLLSDRSHHVQTDAWPNCVVSHFICHTIL